MKGVQKLKLPDYQKKQQLLYTGNRAKEELIAYGDGFLEAGRLSDALEFYQKAGYREGLEKIKNAGKLSGDVMIFMQACKALNFHPTEAEWQEIGLRARDLKKYSFAAQAFERGGQETLLQEIKEFVKAEEGNISK